MPKTRVLFVCMGNICRSPTAHGVFRTMVANAGLAAAIEIDSAGTHAYHLGEPPDRRSQAAARQRGIDLSDLRARQVSVDDFEYFDYVLAMDADNESILAELCPSHALSKLHRLLDFAPEQAQPEVPDPYYSGAQGFELVLDLVEAGCQGLLNEIQQQHK